MLSSCQWEIIFMFIHPRRWVRSWSLLDGKKKKTFKSQFWVVIGPHIWDGEHDNDREHHQMTIFCFFFARTPLNKSSSLARECCTKQITFIAVEYISKLCVGVLVVVSMLAGYFEQFTMLNLFLPSAIVNCELFSSS